MNVQEQENKAQLLAETLHLAREATVIRYALFNGLTIFPEDLRARREEFYRLPYAERRQYHVRPNKATVAMARSEDGFYGLAVTLARSAVEVYRQTGDAGHAMDTIGLPLKTPWVEQKRNSQGIAEVLATDLYVRDPEGELTAMEVVEQGARAKDYYETLPVQIPVPPDEAVDTHNRAERLMQIARERIPQKQFAMFLAVKVDGVAHREVAREFNVSYRQVWQTVESVRDSLRRIGAES